MGYTSFTKIRELNKCRYNIFGPTEPDKISDDLLTGNLERLALKFIRDGCEELGFDKENEFRREFLDSDGKSAGKSQIPYNMEKDINRLCLERAIHRFMVSGASEDAFDVYFCFLEMFIGNYSDSKKMIEMLFEFENNSSVLLMKHRDHYAHSVYVFLLGLAIFEEQEGFASKYMNYYGLPKEKAHEHFLKYYGMAALFHDIGYPFELIFEQIKSYFGDSIEKVPFPAYKNLDEYIIVPECDFNKFKVMHGREENSRTIIDLIAQNISDKFEKKYSDYSGFIKYRENGTNYYDYICNEILRQKPLSPEKFNGYMDHAVFSAIILLKQLIETLPEKELSPVYVDVASAIALHNSMYKFSITNVKEKNGEFNSTHHLKVETHPLAYMLMLCDELQCWDRIAYGQNSRQQYHPMWCDLIMEGQKIHAIYYYDNEYSSNIHNGGTYKKMQNSPDGKCSFLKDIEDIISVNEEHSIISLEISAESSENTRKKKANLSSSSFIHLYWFALALNAQYNARNYETKEWIELTEKQMEDMFESLSLEYKLSNIAQAKAFSNYLDRIGCFYTDRVVDFVQKRELSVKELRIVGEAEHERWNNEKYSMGWTYGTDFITVAKEKGLDKKMVREITRMHNDLGVPFDMLSKTEQNKDTDPMNDMFKLIEQYDGLRVYSL